MKTNKIDSKVNSILKEFKMKLNELSLDSDIVSELLDLVAINPFVLKELGFSTMKRFKAYIEECGYQEFSDIRDEINDLIKNKDNS